MLSGENNSPEVGIEILGNKAKAGNYDIWWISTQCALMTQHFPQLRSLTMKQVLNCLQWDNSLPYANVQYI